RQAAQLAQRAAELARQTPWLGTVVDRVPPDLGPKALDCLERLMSFVDTLDKFLDDAGKNGAQATAAKKLVALVSEFEERANQLEERLQYLHSETAALRQQLASVQAELPA